jgi:hypothetical protein
VFICQRAGWFNLIGSITNKLSQIHSVHIMGQCPNRQRYEENSWYIDFLYIELNGIKLTTEINLKV